MKAKEKSHRNIYGEDIPLSGLDADERKLLKSIQAKYDAGADWNDFDNFWEPKVMSLYAARGLSRPAMRQAAPYRIAQDLSSRIAIASGYARMPNYRDELLDLILKRFRTRREFCQVTGISEDMLSHVLANRKQFAIDTLEEALDKIGYRLKIVPKPDREAQSPAPVDSRSA